MCFVCMHAAYHIHAALELELEVAVSHQVSAGH